jgi:hypothetical protein
MEIHSTDGARFELAIDRLEEGNTIVFRGFGFSIGSTVEVRVPCSRAPENVTADRARADISLAEEAFLEFGANSERFAQLTGGKPPIFILLHDYGMGAIELCRKTGCGLEWAEGYPKKPSTGAP